jgi:hypothetical protein
MYYKRYTSIFLQILLRNLFTFFFSFYDRLIFFSTEIVTFFFLKFLQILIENNFLFIARLMSIKEFGSLKKLGHSSFVS